MQRDLNLVERVQRLLDGERHRIMLCELLRQADLFFFPLRCVLLCLLPGLFLLQFLLRQLTRIILLLLGLLVPPVGDHAEDEVEPAPLSLLLVLIALLLVGLGFDFFGRLDSEVGSLIKGRESIVVFSRQQAPVIVHFGKKQVVCQLLFLLFDNRCINVDIGLLAVNSSN